MGRLASALVLAVALTLVLALGVAAGSLPLPPAKSAAVDCDDGAGRAVIPVDAAGAGPFHMAAPDEQRSHYSKAAGRFTTKLPAAVSGPRTVTVRVPERLADRVRLTYAGSGLATEIAFSPCASKAATFFPGGIVFLRQEPISLQVEVEGSGVVRYLRLGLIPPRPPIARHPAR